MTLVPAAAAQTPVADQIHWTIKGPTSVSVSWRGGASTIQYGLTSSYDQQATAVTPSPLPFSSAGPFREARLTGLLPDRLYHYSIGGGPDHTFETPPPPGAHGFTVIVQGDVGDSDSNEEMAGVQSLIASQQPDFVLVVGDLTYADDHGREAVDQHFNDVMVWSQDAAYMPAWGNHDWGSSEDDLRNYKGRFDLPNPQTSPGSPAISCCSEDWYWFDYGSARFIAIPEPWSGAYADWFTKANTIMAEAQANPLISYIVTFGHRPTYTGGDYAPGNSDLRPLLGTLGDRYDKYVLDLSGHDHNYQRSTPQHGVVHVVAGIGGAGLYDVDYESFTAFAVAHHGAVRLRFTPGGIEGTALCGPAGGSTSCVSGSAMDTFLLPNRNPGPPPDRAPVITAPAVVYARPGVEAVVDVTVQDPDGDPIFSLTADPGPLPTVFTTAPDHRSGRLGWTPGESDTGRSFPVTFVATNLLTSTAVTSIAVGGGDRPPLVAAPDSVTATAGSMMTLVVHAKDPDGDAITLLAGISATCRRSARRSRARRATRSAR